MRIAFYIVLSLVSGGTVFMGGGLLQTSIEMNQEKIIAEARADAITDFLAEQPFKVLTNIRLDSIPKASDI